MKQLPLFLLTWLHDSTDRKRQNQEEVRASQNRWECVCLEGVGRKGGGEVWGSCRWGASQRSQGEVCDYEGKCNSTTYLLLPTLLKQGPVPAWPPSVRPSRTLGVILFPQHCANSHCISDSVKTLPLPTENNSPNVRKGIIGLDISKVPKRL